MTTSIKFLDEVAVSVLDSIGSLTTTGISRKVKALVEEGDWDSLSKLWVDPSLYCEAHLYALDAQAVALFSKIEPDNQRRSVTRAVAEQAFLDAEKRCFKTNLRLEKYINNGPFEDPDDIRIIEHIDSIKCRIAKCLGPLPKGLRECGFGKGATYDDRGAEASLFHKITSRPTVTRDARLLLKYFYESAWGRSIVTEQPYRSDPSIVRGNRFTTVLKNIKTDRGICVEPSVNLFLQKGIGTEIRRCLAKVGIDLDKGQSLHRRLAKHASKWCDLATIDLSMASDLIAYALVKLLLPNDWFEVLDSLRSPFTWSKTLKKQGSWAMQEKFSSMGNGFTFELESLLFWAIASEAPAIREGRGLVKVYGDDIIVPAHAASDVLSILKFFGFVPNEKKTYATGSFRESCGADCFAGVDVRPYFRKVIPTEPQHWISMANGLRRASLQMGYEVLDGPYSRAWLKCLDNLPSHIRILRGPDVLGDVVIHDADTQRWKTRESRESRKHKVYSETLGVLLEVCDRGPHRWEREIRIYRPVPVKWSLSRLSPEAQLAVLLYGVDSEGYSPRGIISGYTTSWTSLVN